MNSTPNDLGYTEPLLSQQNRTLNRTMPRRKQTDEPLTIQSVVQWASTLSSEQRRELIDALLTLDDLDSVPGDRFPNNNSNGGGTGRGSIERKMINGCGPYLYLRYWSGGKHRSVYLGKAESFDG